MNTARKGNAAERFVARWLEENGHIVASRRHIGGAGDLLAVNVQTGEVKLVEVKHCKALWQNFRREDRKAMSETPLPEMSQRYVANVKGKTIEWVHENNWP